MLSLEKNVAKKIKAVPTKEVPPPPQKETKPNNNMKNILSYMKEFYINILGVVIVGVLALPAVALASLAAGYLVKVIVMLFLIAYN